jgi:hypothetical protein
VPGPDPMGFWAMVVLVYRAISGGPRHTGRSALR